jgi:hypothetical protein
VHPLSRAGGHPSRAAVAGSLVRSTRGLRRAAFNRPRRHDIASATPCPPDLAPGGVYQAAAVTCGAGGLLHHRFTLTAGLARQFRRRSVFCGTFPRVTPGRRYRPPCPAEPGPSSAVPANRNRRDRPASLPVAPRNCMPCRAGGAQGNPRSAPATPGLLQVRGVVQGSQNGRTIVEAVDLAQRGHIKIHPEHRLGRR